MFYRPDVMVYLWLLPMVGMIILPVLGTLTCRFYQAVERSRLSDVRGYIDLNSFESPDSVQHERRNGPRIRIDGPKAKVARQATCCLTFVTNLSSRGLCLSNIPKKMYNEAGDKLKVVFRTPEREYKMFVRPKWKRSGKSGCMIGAEIITPPAGWESFVNELGTPLTGNVA